MRTNAPCQIAKILLGIGTALALGYSYAYFMTTTTSADDLSNCKEVVANIVSVVHVPESVSSPGRPAAFCDREVTGLLLRSVEHVRIYGVVDPKEQEIALDVLKNSPRKTVKRVLVEFYEKENWKTWIDAPSGTKGGQRGPETPMRRELFERH